MSDTHSSQSISSLRSPKHFSGDHIAFDYPTDWTLEATTTPEEFYYPTVVVTSPKGSTFSVFPNGGPLFGAEGYPADAPYTQTDTDIVVDGYPAIREYTHEELGDSEIINFNYSAPYPIGPSFQLRMNIATSERQVGAVLLDQILSTFRFK